MQKFRRIHAFKTIYAKIAQNFLNLKQLARQESELALKSNSTVARSSSLNLFGSISKLTKVLHLLVCGRCYLNNLSLKIALSARINKVLREFAGKDLVDCYEVV